MEMAGIAACLGLAVIAMGVAAWALARRSREPAPVTDSFEEMQDRLWRLAEAEERYRALVAATMEVIVQRDAEGRITYVNDRFAALLGQPPIALIGATLELQVLERGELATRPDGVRQVEERLMPVDGHPRWFSFVEMPIAGDARGPHWLRAGCDVTERVEAVRALDEAKSRAEAANVAKSRFIATVSHEFRTPLNGILGMADLMIETQLEPEQRTYVEAVQTSGRALLTLVDGILDFSRIEAGRLDLAAEPFDIVEVVEGVVELLAPRAQDRGLEIALDVNEAVAPLRIGDADRVRQILLNLAGNAIKFTQEGGVGVSLSQSEGILILAVEDTGPGIPEDRIPVLFEEFEQGDDSASRRHEGTGLGLAITRRLVERMKGRIEATSTLGRGTVFRVLLPLPAVESFGPQGSALPRSALDGRNVLIVARSPFQAPYLARWLSRAGASAVIVEEAQAGIATLSSSLFDAVIADRSLGDEAVRALAAEARLCGVRCSLILLSPFDRREFGAPGAAGFDSYLIKPVRARSLFDRLLEPRAAKTARPQGARGPAREARRVPRPASVTRRVLLAEDNPINALLATKALERLGAEVVHAQDGLAALGRWEREGPFDLGLIDIRMPGLDGLETARRIRAAEAQTGTAPLRLVALTANAGMDDQRAARAAGFDSFLSKPLDLKALPALLEGRFAPADEAAA